MGQWNRRICEHRCNYRRIGTCAAGCNSGLLPFVGNLVDGMVVTGLFQELIQENGAGNSTAAFLRVTQLTATNTNAGGGILNDTFYFASDQFDPSLPGSAGVGLMVFIPARAEISPSPALRRK